jgi:ribonucleotide reductase alpha subunit
MECYSGCIRGFENIFFTPKNRLMTYHTFLNRIIILGFMGLVGFCLAKAISIGSVMGIILAFISLGAGIYFLYILAKAKRELETEEATQ